MDQNNQVNANQTSVNSPVNSYVPQSQPSNPPSTQPSTSIPQAVQPQNQNPIVAQKKGSNSCLIFTAIGCVLLGLLCCICSVVIVSAPGYLVNQFPNFTDPSAKVKPDSSFASVETINSQVKFTEQMLTDRHDQAYNEAFQSGASTYKVSVTQQEILSLLANSSDTSEQDVSKLIYLKFEDGKATTKVKLDGVIDYLNKQAKSNGSNTDYGDSKLFKDMYLTFVIETNASGTGFEIKEISTGNSIVDSLFNESYFAEVNKDINNSIFGDNTNDLRSVKFETGKIVIEYGV